MVLEKITQEEFEKYTEKGSMFDQISWRLRPDHIKENGLMTREELKDLCFHFYVYGVADSTMIKAKTIHEQQNLRGDKQ